MSIIRNNAKACKHNLVVDNKVVGCQLTYIDYVMSPDSFSTETTDLQLNHMKPQHIR